MCIVPNTACLLMRVICGEDKYLLCFVLLTDWGRREVLGDIDCATGFHRSFVWECFNMFVWCIFQNVFFLFNSKCFSYFLHFCTLCAQTVAQCASIKSLLASQDRWSDGSSMRTVWAIYLSQIVLFYVSSSQLLKSEFSIICSESNLALPDRRIPPWALCKQPRRFDFLLLSWLFNHIVQPFVWQA